MNAHFPTYTELSASHSPSPENGICYTNHSENGGGGSAGGGNGGVCSATATTTSISPSNATVHSNGTSGSVTSVGTPGGDNIGSNIGCTNNQSNGNGNGNIMHHHNQHQQQQQQHQQHLHHQHQHHHGHSCIPATMDGGATSAGQPSFHQLNNNNNNNCAIKHCAGCGGKIVERFFLHALDRYWHNSCLKCYCCGAMLADIGSSCYTRGGMILCKPDYSRMFGTAPCSACGQTIAPNEFVMRNTTPISSQQQQKLQLPHSIQSQGHITGATVGSTCATTPLPVTGHQHPMPVAEHHVYHLKCFACSKCSSQLRPGDRYYMLGGSLVCEQDWLKLLKAANATPPVRKGKVGRPRRTKD